MRHVASVAAFAAVLLSGKASANLTCMEPPLESWCVDCSHIHVWGSRYPGPRAWCDHPPCPVPLVPVFCSETTLQHPTPASVLYSHISFDDGGPWHASALEDTEGPDWATYMSCADPDNQVKPIFGMCTVQSDCAEPPDPCLYNVCDVVCDGGLCAARCQLFALPDETPCSNTGGLCRFGICF